MFHEVTRRFTATTAIKWPSLTVTSLTTATSSVFSSSPKITQSRRQRRFFEKFWIDKLWKGFHQKLQNFRKDFTKKKIQYLLQILRIQTKTFNNQESHQKFRRNLNQKFWTLNFSLTFCRAGGACNLMNHILNILKKLTEC